MKNKKKHHINTFAAVDGVLLFVLSLICLLPIINVLAISFSSRAAAQLSLRRLPIDMCWTTSSSSNPFPSA